MPLSFAKQNWFAKIGSLSKRTENIGILIRSEFEDGKIYSINEGEIA